jgi:pimeloyl-ACP methyl ester carboxylesterase
MLSQLGDNQEFVLQINDLKIAGVAYGDSQKEPILAFHGWLDNAASFELLAQKLNTRKIIAIDLVGHGKSSHRAADTPYYIWDNVTDIFLIVQHLSIEKVDLLGHSMGASIAMLFAACFPEKVNQLFLVDGIAPLDYSTDQLPALMSKAIKQKVKARNSQAKSYIDMDSMIQARAKSRFPVSLAAAKLLVQRGSKNVQGRFYWSSDAALLLPSINRMNKAQIEVFLTSLQASVHIYLGDEGLDKSEWYPYIDLIKNKTIHTFVGNHHLHMQESGAQQIAISIDFFISGKTV